MSIDKGAETLVEDSLRYQLEMALDTAGWTDPEDWVIIGYVEPESSPPVVAVKYNREIARTYEMGNKRPQMVYFVDIDIRGSTSEESAALKDTVLQSVHPLRIINFNTAMPEDNAFDAEDQTLAWGDVIIKSARVVSEFDNTRRVLLTVVPKKPI